jgi:hypothetical protein
VDEFLRLLDERLGDGWMRMAEAANRDAAAEVEVTFARDIKNIAAAAMAQHEVEASVTGHDVFIEQLADVRKLVVNNRRRCWNDFFHVSASIEASEFLAGVIGEGSGILKIFLSRAITSCFQLDASRVAG